MWTYIWINITLEWLWKHSCSTWTPKFCAKAATDLGASESKFKAHYHEGVVCPNCLHTACNSMYFIIKHYRYKAKVCDLECTLSFWLDHSPRNASGAYWLIDWPPTVEMRVHEWSSRVIHAPKMRVAPVSWLQMQKNKKRKESSNFKSQVVMGCPVAQLVQQVPHI